MDDRPTVTYWLINTSKLPKCQGMPDRSFADRFSRVKKNCQPPHHFTKVTSAHKKPLTSQQPQTKLAQLDAELGILNLG
jgi:hypothetical protein